MNVTPSSGLSSRYPKTNICINKNRIKTKKGNNKDYLYIKDDTEFQIEMHNPTSERFLANISINGKSIGPGLVLRPGQRTFLDRYTDISKKFKFSTYEVSKKDQHLTEDNGLIEINFHAEDKYNWTNYTTTLEFTDGPYTFTAPAGTDAARNFDNSTANINYTSSKVETGTVEKGSESRQKLVDTDGTFSIWSTATKKYKILPESQKTVHMKDIRSYCTECGRRSKNGWKFCPSCGTKA